MAVARWRAALALARRCAIALDERRPLDEQDGRQVVPHSRGCLDRGDTGGASAGTWTDSVKWPCPSVAIVANGAGRGSDEGHAHLVVRAKILPADGDHSAGIDSVGLEDETRRPLMRDGRPRDGGQCDSDDCDQVAGTPDVIGRSVAASQVRCLRRGREAIDPGSRVRVEAVDPMLDLRGHGSAGNGAM